MLAKFGKPNESNVAVKIILEIYEKTIKLEDFCVSWIFYDDTITRTMS